MDGDGLRSRTREMAAVAELSTAMLGTPSASASGALDEQPRHPRQRGHLAVSAPSDEAEMSSGNVGGGRWHGCEKRDDCAGCRERSDGAWSSFAMNACICLEDRVDRLEMSQNEFHRVGLCGSLQYYRPTRPDASAVARLGFERVAGFGSWESHRTVAQRALDLGVFDAARARGQIPALVVFEDDVQFLDSVTAQRLGRLQQQVASLPPDWHVLMLGHSPMPVPGTCRPAAPFSADWSVWRVNSFMLHAYILSEAGARLLADTPYHRYASIDWGLVGHGDVKEHFLDDWMRQRANMYAVLPMMCVQADSPSDQRLDGKEFGIRLHARLARHWPWFLEGLFMFIPFVAFVLSIIVSLVYLLAILRTLSQRPSVLDTASSSHPFL